MVQDTLTLSLGGNVPLPEFNRALSGFQILIELLAKEVGENAPVTWVVDELSGGSANVTVRGESSQPEVVQKVQQAYVVIGHALETGKPIPYSPPVVRAAESITQVLNGQITSVSFEAGGEVATVTSGVPVEQSAGLVGAYGSIEGTIETLTHRRWLGFMLYDLLNDHAIRCVLQPDQADLARESWDQRVIVYGWIRRDPKSGYPVNITPVLSIERVQRVDPGGFLRARGVSPAQADEPSPEDVIRRLRDA
ncbi:MAG: hypothetical protein U0031_00475 [Thermomicrobiales bacterium]